APSNVNPVSFPALKYYYSSFFLKSKIFSINFLFKGNLFFIKKFHVVVYFLLINFGTGYNIKLLMI
ncbi:hypothetical protein BM530_19015, partial [Clostridioides difficile]